jgi:hypothetical protein
MFIFFYRDGLHISLYSNDVSNSSNVFKIYPALINVGINEVAFSSYFLGKNELQLYTIKETYHTLKSFFENSKNSLNLSMIVSIYSYNFFKFHVFKIQSLKLSQIYCK